MATISEKSESELHFGSVEDVKGDATQVPTPSKAHVIEQMIRPKQDRVDTTEREIRVQKYPHNKVFQPLSEKVSKL